MAQQAKKFFRVAVAGATIDGRTIKPEWLTQAAANYDRDVYGARVWVDHLRSSWADSPFSPKGDVIELKAEVIKGGKLDGKMALFAAIDPLADLVKLNKAGKKIYTSIEIEPRFADTGEAYMMGLAVTDEPASLGTEILKFHAKKDPEKFRSEYVEIDMQGMDDEDDEDDEDNRVHRTAKGDGVLSKLRARFRQLSGRQDDADNFTKDAKQAFGEISDALDALVDRVEQVEADAKRYTKLKKAHDTLADEFKTLSEQLSKQENGAPKRNEATGSEGAIKATC